MCYICGDFIQECMGSIHAGSFVAAIKANDEKQPAPPIRELCPYCATYYANTTPDINPYPDPYAPHPDPRPQRFSR